MIQEVPPAAAGAGAAAAGGGEDKGGGEVARLLAEWEAARVAGDYATSDALRATLREAHGVNPGARARRGQNTYETGFEGHKWALDFRYDSDWGQRACALQLVSTHSYLVSSEGWALSPRLRRYRTIPTHELRLEVARALGRRLWAARPAVLCVEKPLLGGFLDAFRGAAKGGGGCGGDGGGPIPPFVLLVIHGGDDPFTREQQAALVGLPGLRACFGANLHAPEEANLHLFHPLPIGLHGNAAPAVLEAAVARVRAAVIPWQARDPRLLLAPMRASSRLRVRYLQVLSQPRFSHLVRVAEGRLPPEEFLGLMASHRATLSPPGKGHDCYRTWQALAVGCVPLVTLDPAFDRRLYEGAGPVYIPRPEDVTPMGLEQLLAGLQDPIHHSGRLRIEHWRGLWAAILEGTGGCTRGAARLAAQHEEEDPPGRGGGAPVVGAGGGGGGVGAGAPG